MSKQQKMNVANDLAARLSKMKKRLDHQLSDEQLNEILGGFPKGPFNQDPEDPIGGGGGCGGTCQITCSAGCNFTCLDTCAYTCSHTCWAFMRP